MNAITETLNKKYIKLASSIFYNEELFEEFNTIFYERYGFKLGQDEAYQYFKSIEPFGINENIFDTGFQGISLRDVESIEIAVHKVLVELFLKIIIFGGLKIKPDENTLDTPYRITKSWFGKNIHDHNEFFSGRWTFKPEITKFEIQEKIIKPITITVSLNSMCSHHFVRFGTDTNIKDSKVVISYIPDKYIIGLSKFKRFINWISRRGWTQEELTQKIGQELVNTIKPKMLYVGLINIQHGCMSFRGANDTDSYTTTEYYYAINEKYEKLLSNVFGKLNES